MVDEIVVVDNDQVRSPLAGGLFSGLFGFLVRSYGFGLGSRFWFGLLLRFGIRLRFGLRLGFGFVSSTNGGTPVLRCRSALSFGE